MSNRTLSCLPLFLKIYEYSILEGIALFSTPTNAFLVNYINEVGLPVTDTFLTNLPDVPLLVVMISSPWWRILRRSLLKRRLSCLVCAVVIYAMD